MMTFSDDPNLAEQQMHAIIFYLTTFGYIDGDFDAKEKEFVRKYIGDLVGQRADQAMKNADVAMKKDVVSKFTAHFHQVFEGIDENVRELFTESVAENEDPTAFVHSKLKVRCFEIFQSFDRPGQEQLMATIDELIMADGQVHPAEAQFRAELAQLLDGGAEIELQEDDESGPAVEVAPAVAVPRIAANHPFFSPTEFHYSRDPERISQQISADLALLDRVATLWAEQRKKGIGKLAGKKTVADLSGEGPFLDGHVYWQPAVPGRRYDILVLGDLHGCYSVLKAALMQSRFFEKVDAFRKDPENHPEPRLVLLGDYIDRGLFSLNVVLRIVLQLLATAPEFVTVLRGNHEYYVEFKGNVYGGVKPAEAINTLKPHVPIEVFKHYASSFETMPNMLFFDRMLFVHGGIPKDRLLKERYQDLSSLNDPDIRFQMMWSDPSTADVIPADLQDKSARFAFGRMQFKAFMQRVGCHTMFRGHEKVNDGFHVSYDDPQARLITLFSAGGQDNDDLPRDSSYRQVVPMALTIEHGPDGTKLTPWAPDYKTYNDPRHNAFFQVPPEITHKAE
ncbi:MAG TPA: metallophosphoesterase [Polyangiaceae bacterium]|nr:metallophosphoesterase [Polyangiaceae bacterium]